MNFIFKNLKPYKKELILGPTFKLCEAIIEISLPIILSHIINDFSSVVKTNYTFLCLFLLSLVLIAFGSSISCQYMAAKTSQNFGKSIRKNFFEKLSTLSANQLENFSSASLTNRFTNDIGNLELAVALLIRLVIRVPFIFIGSLLMIFLLNKTISIIVLLSTIILGIFVFLIFKYSSPIFEKYNLKLDRMLTRLKENLENVQLVRGFNMQHFENKNFEKNNKLLGKNYFKANFISSLLNPISTIILDITILEILYFTKFNPGNLLIGDLIAIINYISQMLTVIIVFSNLVTTYSKAFSSYNRLNDFFNLNPEFIYGNENTFDNNAIAVKFENVNFSFSKETNLFENLNIAIASGEIIGIVGLTSAGKTTFLNLINRSLDCTSGNIKLFEKSIKDYSFDALKENITYISQKPEFFTNSIKENILLGKEYSPHSFDYALQNSDSKEFIERFTEK